MTGEVEELVLVAASGLAREVVALLRGAGRPDPVAVLDDDPARWGTELDGVPVLGPAELAADHPGWQLLLCAGSGRVRRALRDRLSGLGIGVTRYASVVDPHAVVPPGCTVGHGCVLMAGVVLTAGVEVGDHVVAMPHVVLTHDVVVGELATLCAGVALAGSVHVGTAAYVGTNACVRQGLTLGEGSTLGMGSVLLTDLPSAATWAGNPARPLPAPTSVTPSRRAS